jgi:hypothetical protein
MMAGDAIHPSSASAGPAAGAEAASHSLFSLTFADTPPITRELSGRTSQKRVPMRKA